MSRVARAAAQGYRMAGIGIAVEELDGALRVRMKAAWIFSSTNTAPIGMLPLVNPLAQVSRSGTTPPALRGEGFADAARNSVITSSKISRMPCLRVIAQPLKVALGRQHHAGRAGHRLDDHRGDILGAVQGHQAFQLLGLFRAMLGQADGEKRCGRRQGVRQVVDPRQQVGERPCGC